MTRTPKTTVLIRAQRKALESPDAALLMAPLGSNAQETPDTLFRVVDDTDARNRIGDSEANEAVALWFDANLQNNLDLYIYTHDTTGWLPNTWSIIVAAGTASESGTLNGRLMRYSVPVAVAKDDDQDAVAIEIAAAITGSQAPFTAAVDGVSANQVNVTSVYPGLHTQRYPVSFDLYRDRGELGVDGIDLTVASDATGAGEPVLPVNGPTIGDALFDWYLHPFRGTAYLDTLETHIQDRWDTANNFAHAITALAGTQADAIAFGSARNDEHHTYVGVSDSPISETEASVAMLDGILQQQVEEDKPNISGQRMLIPRMPAFPTATESEPLLQAAVTPLRSAQSSVFGVRVVTNRDENDLAAEDLGVFDIGAVLALREIGNRLALWGQLNLGKGIVSDGTPVSPTQARRTISQLRLVASATEVLKGLWRDAIIFADSEGAVEDVLTSVTVTEDGGIATGFALVFEPTLVRSVINLELFVRYA